MPTMLTYGLHYNNTAICGCLVQLCWLLSLPMQLSTLLIYSCIPYQIYMAIQSAMPNWFSKFPIAFYARLEV